MTAIEIINDFKSQGYWRTFKEWAIVIAIMLFVLMLLTGNSFLTSLTVSSLLGLGTALIFIPFAYWYQEHKSKEIMREKLNLPTFRPLIDIGFQKRDVYLHGIYKSFYMRSWWTEGNPFGSYRKMTYSVRVVFFFVGDFKPTDEFKVNYAKAEQIIWREDCVESVINSDRKKLPDSQELLKRADRLINLMQILDLKPGIVESKEEPVGNAS